MYEVGGGRYFTWRRDITSFLPVFYVVARFNSYIFFFLSITNVGSQLIFLLGTELYFCFEIYTIINDKFFSVQ